MRILVGMSGGVDSTYAAMKLKQAGHDVEGAVLVMHPYTDVESAKAASQKVGIPLHVVDCTAEFDKHVRSYFVSEYMKGRTPNPCIVCNGEVKFKILYEYAIAHGFEKIATGHYAGIENVGDGDSTRYAFRRAEDSRKDQTYMLYRLSQKIIGALVLPLAEERKEDVKSFSDSAGLLPKETKESQEICFIPDGDYASYVESVAGKSKGGYFVDENGKVIAEHKGIAHYTLGQRKGLGVALGKRAFVSEIDAERGNITLSTEGKKIDKLYIDGVVYSGMAEQVSELTVTLDVKLRYQATPVKAKATLSGGGAYLELSEPVKAVTPGQSAVLYKDGVVMCGGFIRI